MNIKGMLKGTLIVAALSFIVIGMSACKKEGPMESAGKKMDNATKQAGDKMEEAGQKVQDAAKNANP